MTRRLYYADSLLHQFDAVVTSCEAADDRFRVTLDASAFYPTSGGQPHDLGTMLSGDGRARVRVIDVIDDEATGEVVHVVNGPLLPGAAVRGVIDDARRLDHMQQHSGQHILSAVFAEQWHASTLSFHMGAESSTIDLARELTADEISAGELAANEVVWRDLDVRVRYVSEAEAAALPLRKESTRTGTLRLVEIPGCDLSACGGTHVTRTGMIGLIGVTGWERFKGGSRVSFVCGRRARTAFATLRRVTQTAAQTLTIAVPDLPNAVARMQTQIKDQQRSIKHLQEKVAVTVAEDLRKSAEPGIGGARVVIREQPGWDAAAIKCLAAAVVSSPGFIVVLMGEGTPVPVVVARSSDVGMDAGVWMTDATAALGGRGGGRPEMAQGGITAGTSDILARARRTLK